MKQLLLLFMVSSCLSIDLSAQYTRQDSLRGSVTDERAWWDLNFYHLDIEVDPATKTLRGKNTVQYTVLDNHQVMQIDLQDPLRIDRITQDGQMLEWHSEGPAHFITLKKPQKLGARESIVIRYGGTPHEAMRAPWDGGISWKKDSNDKPFVASSCQGIGASIWWPCKDHMYDEVDSMLISVTVPAGLMNVSNGRLHKKETLSDGRVKTDWKVSNPINNYGVNINIGDYVHFSDTYAGEKGPLDMDYYVLRENLELAKEQFKQAPLMMKAFEHWFGPYPFYEDSYKLVEAPYLGMEHQSSVTYGNGYKNGYLGRDLSGTGQGLTFDFIIVHESGHEWFANNITYRDQADMWIHEGFTAYSENLLVEYWQNDKKAGADYVLGTRSNISNDKPIIADYEVNGHGSGDMYYKGANLLHMIRQIVGDDEQWRQILRGLNERFYHQTVTTQQIEKYIIEKSGKDLQAVFDQYLRDTRIPIFEYRVSNNGLTYRWSNVIEGFRMPIEIEVDGVSYSVNPMPMWQKLTTEKMPETVKVDRDYYVASMSNL